MDLAYSYYHYLSENNWVHSDCRFEIHPGLHRESPIVIMTYVLGFQSVKSRHTLVQGKAYIHVTADKHHLYIEVKMAFNGCELEMGCYGWHQQRVPSAGRVTSDKHLIRGAEWIHSHSNRNLYYQVIVTLRRVQRVV